MADRYLSACLLAKTNGGGYGWEVERVELIKRQPFLTNSDLYVLKRCRHLGCMLMQAYDNPRMTSNVILSVLIVPSIRMAGDVCLDNHCSCQARLRPEKAGLSYCNAHSMKPVCISCMSPPGAIRSPNRAFSRAASRSRRTDVSVTTSTMEAPSNFSDNAGWA